MRVHIAEACGFCYGVRRAVELASTAEKGTHTLGPIIHNPQLVNSLSARGVSPVDSLQDVAEFLERKDYRSLPQYIDRALLIPRTSYKIYRYRTFKKRKRF